jgi:hypothetical protein
MLSRLTPRLDEKTRKRISHIAQRKQLSTSEVVRQAIEAWANRHEPVTSPYEAVKDLIGVVHGGNPKGSVQTGRGFIKLLKKRRGSRG